MIRSRARLLETDDVATTRARIADLVAEHVPDEAERRRVEVALLALLGTDEAPAGGAAELFSAWRTFFERLAAKGTVALLFEDLHWADSGTLDFIEHLMEWSRDVPILIITLARPELLDKRPGWGAGRRAFLALDLQPLDEPSMRDLLAGLAPGLPEPAVQSIVARAEGIPLYAVETIRMLVADGRLVERPSGGYEPAGPLGELAIPGTLHALIAARLDALEPRDRAVLQDAAVLGTSFTSDALAAIEGGDRDALEVTLARLVRNELLRVELDPRSPGARPVRVRPGAHPRGGLLDALAPRPPHAPPRRRAPLRGDRRRGAGRRARGALRLGLQVVDRRPGGGGARRPGADRAPRRGRLAPSSWARPAQAVTFLRQAVEVTTIEADRADLLEQATQDALISGQLELADGLAAEAIELRERGGDDAAIAAAIRLRAEGLIIGRRRDEGVRMLEARDRPVRRPRR